MLTPSWIDDGSPIDDPFGYGERAVTWLRRLKHPKNPLPGSPFQLDPWQERIIRKLYGPRHPDGSRVVRRLVLLLPRGNRKTALCAAITLLHLMGPERIPGGLTISAASAHVQAMELFNEAATIVSFDPRMEKHLSVLDSSSTIKFPKERSRYIAVASDGNVQHGKTPNVVIADELHAWEGGAGRKQWDALDSSIGKIKNQLLIIATTSGRGRDNLAWETVERAIKIQKGEIDDPATLPVIFMAEPDDDWTDEAVWYAVNPGLRYGYPDIETYRDKVQRAVDSPSDRDRFLQYQLNVWLDSSLSPFVDMRVYDECEGDVDLDRLESDRVPCWLGVDLSSHIDLSVIVAAWPDRNDGFIIHPWLFCPEDNLTERENKTGAPYRHWSEMEHITATPGNVIDVRRVEDVIRELCARFNVQEIAFDPALAKITLSNLVDDGFPAVEMRQGSLTMMPALATLERGIVGRTIRHNGHPVLRHCFANAEAKRNSHGHVIRLAKSKLWLSIDGAVAAAMAVSRAANGDSGRSSYETYQGDITEWGIAYV